MRFFSIGYFIHIKSIRTTEAGVLNSLTVSISLLLIFLNVNPQYKHNVSRSILTGYTDVFLYIPYRLSEASMGNVTKYLQKLGMGVYDNQLGISKK